VVLGEVLEALAPVLGTRAHDLSLWSAIRAAHAAAVLGHPADELAETFFNSITRRVLQTVGTNQAVEYLDFRFERLGQPAAELAVRSFAVEGGARDAVRALLSALPFRAPWAHRDADADRAAAEIEREWAGGGAPFELEALEFLPVFYRRKGAYLVGRARGGNRAMPLVLALVHGPDGVAVDAVLPSEDAVSIVFSFTRSYFLVDIDCPSAAIAFLRTLMPLKPVSELYTSLGHHKHGKTEFYRALRRHLNRTAEKFERAPGARGMVMEVFTLPSFGAVFKVIRDTFPPPKRTTPAEVRQRYKLVFAHDRAGRLVDAQEFQELAFARDRFAPALLEDLLETAAHTVRVEGEQVVIDHLYAERRVQPLDLFLEDAAPEAALAAAHDYGQTIRDLASTGIFPGDLLLKNFGVTRHGRIVFYDYDELRLLSECRFREFPVPRTPEDELADEPWFYVGPNDVFPEELRRFVPFGGPLRDAFLASHGDLYQTAFWHGLQADQAAGVVADIFPYPDARRLAP
jgi:isocitrate dehydrogenase kinase/phosphatase